MMLSTHPTHCLRRWSLMILAVLMLAACGLKEKQPLQPTAIPAIVANQALPTITRAALTNTPAPTATSVPLQQTSNTSSSSSQSTCTPRTDWKTYIVVAGDTLAVIAQRSNSTVEALRSGNCLSNANVIYVGQPLRVPVLPLTPAPSLTPIGVGGQVSVSPNSGIKDGWLVLQAGTVVTLSWQEAQKLGAVDVYFHLTPTGTGMTPTVIAEDHNTADGVSAQWTVPSSGIVAYLSARAATQGGRVLVDQTTTDLDIYADASGTTGTPQIISFAVGPNPVQRGGTVTLSWEVTGTNSVRIDRVAERGTPIYSDEWGKNLPRKGSVTYTLPPDYINSISFILWTGGLGPSAGASTQIQCPYNNLLQPSCPITRDELSLAYQPFEGGYMVWRGNFRQIYVIYNDTTWQAFEDTWVENEPIYPLKPEDGSIPCPALRPQRGFGKLWYLTQPTVRQRLGCPTASETAYTSIWEVYQGYRSDGVPDVIHMFRMPDGRTMVLDVNGTWHTLG